jgi:nitroreductase
MNPVIETILKRKSVRAYEEREIEMEAREMIFQSALRAPTAGDMMLYSIIEVSDQTIKDQLAKTCDNQPFIARAPLVLLFLADYQRWYDYFLASGVEQACVEKNIPMRKPQEGDLFLACCDALLAAQNAVIGAESLGIGSCYIGDVMDQYETHRALFNLPKYVFPIALLCFGYPTEQQKNRSQTSRFERRFICFENRYKILEKAELDEMFSGRNGLVKDGENFGQLMYSRKFNADFSIEMNRSVKAILAEWTG